jgi:hypothetical protein
MPALTDVKVPAGGVAWPEVFDPQQTMVPSVASAHAWSSPTLTAVNESTVTFTCLITKSPAALVTVNV